MSRWFEISKDRFWSNELYTTFLFEVKGLGAGAGGPEVSGCAGN